MMSLAVALLGSTAPSVRLFTLNSHNVSRDKRVRYADVDMGLERNIADLMNGSSCSSSINITDSR
jgi:hypothetical protein